MTNARSLDRAFERFERFEGSLDARAYSASTLAMTVTPSGLVTAKTL